MPDAVPLAQKYRPHTFADMIGQNLNASILSKMVEKNAVPHALLFSGPSGTGKTSMARILAAALNPSQADAIADGSSVDIVEVDSASNGGVADVRQMVETLRYSSAPGSRRVVIYDECHTITKEGWNALLKPTEEESGTTFIFVTTEPERIKDTVLSRLREFEFRKVTPYEIGQRLVQVIKAESIQIEGKLVGHLAEQANGNVRSAVIALEQVWHAEITTLDEYIALRGEADRSPELLQAMLTNDFAQVHQELDAQLDASGNPHRVTNNLVQLFSDILVTRAGGSTGHVGQAQQVRKELAFQLDPERIIAAMKVIWDLKTRIRTSSNTSLDVRLSTTLVAEIIGRGRQAAAPSAPVAPVQQAPAVSAPPRKLTLSDMMKTKV